MRTTVETDSRPSHVVVDVHIESGRAPLAPHRVEALVHRVLRGERVRAATISVVFVTSRRSARLHREIMGVAGATDIITLEYPGSGNLPVAGELYICADVARTNAQEHGVSAREELARLVIHGTLHALGYNHPVDGARTASPMWKRQERYLAAAARAGDF
jgi:probable rRNA maturation factor